MRFVALALTLLLAACGGAPAAGDSGEQPEEPQVPLLERLRLDASQSAEEPFQTLRYNPTASGCACPPFELRIGGRWWRVDLTPLRPEELALPELATRAAEDLAAGRTPHYYVVGTLYDDPVGLCPNGRYGFELRVESVHYDAPPPPAPLP